MCPCGKAIAIQTMNRNDVYWVLLALAGCAFTTVKPKETVMRLRNGGTLLGNIQRYSRDRARGIPGRAFGGLGGRRRWNRDFRSDRTCRMSLVDLECPLHLVEQRHCSNQTSPASCAQRLGGGRRVVGERTEGLRLPVFEVLRARYPALILIDEHDWARGVVGARQRSIACGIAAVWRPDTQMPELFLERGHSSWCLNVKRAR